MASCGPWQSRVEGARPIYLRWFISWRCNYRCSYCYNRSTAASSPRLSLRRPLASLRTLAGFSLGSRSHRRRRQPGAFRFQRSDHAFAIHPPEAWSHAIGALAPAKVALAISGGEPYLDRKNFARLLADLTAMDHVEWIRIDTNGTWRSGDFAHVDWRKVFHNVSFHPQMTGLATFCDSIREKLDRGVPITMVNYVLEPGQVDDFLRVKEATDALGVFLNANVYFGDRPQSESAVALYHRFLPEIDVALKLNQVTTKGRPCGFPCSAYRVDPAGKMHVGCFPQRTGDLIAGDIPERFADDVPCPQRHCGCLDMYAFSQVTGRARRHNLLAEYVEACRAAREKAAPTPAC